MGLFILKPVFFFFIASDYAVLSKYSYLLIICKQLEFQVTVFLGLVWFDGTSTIVGYLMPNPLYTYILNIYDLVGFGFMAHQPLLVI